MLDKLYGDKIGIKPLDWICIIEDEKTIDCYIKS